MYELFHFPDMDEQNRTAYAEKSMSRISSQKKFIIIAMTALGAILFIGVLVSSWLWYTDTASTPSERTQQTQENDTADERRVCPDQWYENRMPQATPEDEEPETGTERQYFIVDSERVEYDDMDVEWVKNNCSVNEPSPVY